MNSSGFKALNRVLQFAQIENKEDVLFICGDGTVKAHKFIISMDNSFFKDLFFRVEDNLIHIYVPDFRTSVIKQALKKLYNHCDPSEFRALMNIREKINLKTSTETINDNMSLIRMTEESSDEIESMNLDDEKSNLILYQLPTDDITINDELSFSDNLIDNLTDPLPDELPEILNCDFEEHKNNNSYHCHYCNTRFESYNLYCEHKMKLHRATFYMCPNCPDDSIEYYNLHDLFKHIKSEKCDEDFNEQHYAKEHCEFYKCIYDDCHLIFKTTSLVNNHFQESHNAQESLSCQFCHSKFKTNDLLITHICSKHKSIVYKCMKPKCTDRYTSFKSLKVHQLANHLGLRIKCDYCQLIFKCKSSYDLHVNKNHKIRESLSCEICGAFFTNKYYFNSHKKSAHQNIKCRKCNLNFKDGKSYSTHFNRTHKENKLIPCNFCGKSIADRNMKSHEIRVHSNNPKIKCYICEKETNNVYSLMKHVSRFHKQKPKSLNDLIKMYHKDSIKN